MDEQSLYMQIARARRLLDDGETVAATAAVDQLLAAAGDSPYVGQLHALLLMDRGETEAACEEARRVVDLLPESADAWTVFGRVYWADGRLSGAQEAFENACRLSEDSPSRLARYAWFVASERGSKLGERAANRAIDSLDGAATDADHALAWAAHAMSRMRAREFDRAVDSIDRAVSFDPHCYEVRWILAHLLIYNDEKDAARNLLLEMKGTPEVRTLINELENEAAERMIRRRLIEKGGPSTLSPNRKIQQLGGIARVMTGPVGGFFAATVTVLSAVIISPWFALGLLTVLFCAYLWMMSKV